MNFHRLVDMWSTVKNKALVALCIREPMPGDARDRRNQFNLTGKDLSFFKKKIWNLETFREVPGGNGVPAGQHVHPEPIGSGAERRRHRVENDTL